MVVTLMHKFNIIYKMHEKMEKAPPSVDASRRIIETKGAKRQASNFSLIHPFSI